MLKIRLSHFYNPNINDYLGKFKIELPEISFTISSDQSDGARCNSWWKSELGLRQFFNIREATKVTMQQHMKEEFFAKLRQKIATRSQNGF